MADQEDKNDSAGDANPGNPLPSSLTEVLQSADFIAVMSKAFVPLTVDGTKLSLNLPAQADSESFVFLQEQTNCG